MRKTELPWLHRERNRKLQLKLTRLSPLGGLEKLPINARIRFVRESAHLSQSELAKLCRCTQQEIGRMEKNEGAGAVKISSLQKIAKALDCEFVYGFVPNKSSKTWSYFSKELPKGTIRAVKKNGNKRVQYFQLGRRGK